MLILLLCLAGTTVFAQNSGSLSKKEQKQLLKEERQSRAVEEAELKSFFIDSTLNTRSFALEADMLYDKYGQSIPVQSNINFILVDSVYGVLQVGDPFRMGGNGLGGVTYEGSVNSYNFEKNVKRNNYMISYTLISTFGSFDVNINVLSNGKAEATVRGTFSGSIRYSGNIVGLANTRVFKGMSF